MYRLTVRLLTALILTAGSLSTPALAEVQWQTDLNAGINMAKGNNRLVFLEVSAPWCPACRKLDKLMHDKRVGQFLDPHFVSVKLDADSPQGQGIMRQYGAKGIPALFVFNSRGDLKGKMSGAPQDFAGFQHFVTNLAGGEAAVAAAGSSNSSGWNGGTTNGAPPQGNLQNFGQGQAYQQPQQMPYPQGQPQGNYFQQQPLAGYGQPQYQQQPVNYAPPQYQQPPANYVQPQFPQGQPQANYPAVQYQPQQPQPQFGYPAQQLQGGYSQPYYAPNYQQGQPGAYSQPSYPAGQQNGYAPASAPMQNPYAGGVYPAGQGMQPGSAQQVPPQTQQSQ